jgi:murein peptide amidase A
VVRRLGLNAEGYRGERIDPCWVQAECREAAARYGWSVDYLPPDSLERVAFHRPACAVGAPNFYLSAGIHGDEPAGPLAILRLLEEDRWPDAHFWVVPCLNPTGFLQNTRENGVGIDLNRDFLSPGSTEVQGQIKWLTSLPQLDLVLLFHEDWEANGFYCYELNGDGRPPLAESMIEAVSALCPIEHQNEIEGRTVDRPGIIRPGSDPASRPRWPEAIWMAVHKSKLIYTLEAPSDWELPVRVDALVAAARTAFKGWV